MSQLHNIFCASADAIPTADIAARATDSWLGEGQPTFQPPPDADPQWTRFEVSLPGVGRPLVFLHDVAPDDVAVYVSEAVEETARVLPPQVAAALTASRQVIGIELMPERLTDDAWEMLDIVQSFLATRLAGILVTPDGVYDARLQPIAVLP